MTNALNWFEIPVTDMDRAQRFYETLLDKPLRREAMGPYEMAVFPYEEPSGTGGALIRGGNASAPSTEGSLVYLNLVGDTPLAAVIERATRAGAAILLDRMELPDGIGVIAHLQDTEGNRVGLHAMA
ncbi:VOC family protein [Pelomonas sp. SE-A7]|uniref:VOC family protein n=1 Tax=Pelomonas sp. SE-A7 TaxID=3054953 RepID=UPI00259C951D|nr:VOC family protein [Pelomonas sp. SE-A7]MDM4768208.1 VOC family protein [Pelomonas sp. SE-A7]